MSKKHVILAGAVVLGYFLAPTLTGVSIPGGFNPFAYAHSKGASVAA